VTTQEQYKLACRLLRLRLADDVAEYHQRVIFASFGVKADAMTAAYKTCLPGWDEFEGWVNRKRYWQWWERREGQPSLAVPAR